MLPLFIEHDLKLILVTVFNLLFYGCHPLIYPFLSPSKWLNLLKKWVSYSRSLLWLRSDVTTYARQQCWIPGFDYIVRFRWCTWISLAASCISIAPSPTGGKARNVSTVSEDRKRRLSAFSFSSEFFQTETRENESRAKDLITKQQNGLIDNVPAAHIYVFHYNFFLL